MRMPSASGGIAAALLALVIVHFFVLMSYFEPAIGTPDASGYFVQSRLIAAGGRTWFERESPLQYVNQHWLSPGGDRYFSQYPPGLSALGAIVFRFAGPTAALLVNPVLSSLTLPGLFLLCRVWTTARWRPSLESQPGMRRREVSSSPSPESSSSWTTSAGGNWLTSRY